MDDCLTQFKQRDNDAATVQYYQRHMGSDCVIIHVPLMGVAAFGHLAIAAWRIVTNGFCSTNSMVHLHGNTLFILWSEIVLLI